ncbi:hypothetical protein DQ238_10400 [Geodermatophilus sp. TF02-6]|uniref:DUF6542 domain-containing protein n=1 Tax=Geodermatophilus sp. TF02-6 TaxID=2250575 RepID=UPI000DEBBE0F|nr:DUF6542 domain-containing protein [Geodermatophilus sp. TF02-6]RBY79591.1 hypothetical protein DQ238_10400 [Geodermatophilus sp. TF02-6]
MASASTADTWRGSPARAQRHPGSWAPRPGAADPVARIGRPPVPPPAGRRASDLPPFPEQLARAGRGPDDDRRGAAQPRPAAAGPSRPVEPGRPLQHSRPVEPGRPIRSGRRADRAHPADRDRPERPRERTDLDGRGRGPRPPVRRGATRVTSAPERGSRLRGAVAVLGIFLLTLAGAALDSWLGIGLGLFTLVTLTGATAAGTLLVRRRDLLTPVVAPPLVFVAVAVLNSALAPSASLNVATIATLLIRGFPTMAIATGVGVVVALVRWAARR